MPNWRGRRRKIVRRVREVAVFWEQFRENFKATGAIFPSSRPLANAITRQMEQHPTPARYLEIGPGTGALTRAMVERLGPGDELVLVEINPTFVHMLRERLERNAKWRCKRHQIQVVHERIERLDAREPFDAIVCGLPFNNFAPEQVDTILNTAMRHLGPNGGFSFFEYIAIQRLRAPFISKSERARLDAVNDVLAAHASRHKVDEDIVLRNIPPAVVHHLRV